MPTFYFYALIKLIINRSTFQLYLEKNDYDNTVLMKYILNEYIVHVY